MKTLPLICIIFCFCFNMKAQNSDSPKSAFLFDSFTKSNILLKNKLLSHNPLNYNCVKQVFHFMENGQEMVLDDISNVDTIYIDNRKFVPHLKRFMEYIPVGNTMLLVDYKTKALPIGKVGAFGTTSQGSVQNIDYNPVNQQKMEVLDNSVYQFKIENSYYLLHDQKKKKFNNTKSFLKLFPKERAESILSFIKDKKINMEKVDDVIKLIEFTEGK